jgi:large subunit ribosomal protein L7/L12
MAKMSTAELVDVISGMTLIEVSDLVKALEDHLGVKAAAPVAVAAGPAVGPAAAPAEAAPEPTEFTATLSEIGPNKINVIKAVRELAPSLGLKEAKDLVDGAPKPIKENVTKEEAEAVKTKLSAVGATVTIVAVG